MGGLLTFGRSSGFPLLQYASKQTFVVAVKDLIDEDRRWWNEPLIDEVLQPDTATAIKNLNLGNHNGKDQPVQGERKSGVFSVSFFYAMLV